MNMISKTIRTIFAPVASYARLALLPLLFLSACAGQDNVFVLLPDENGKVGSIEVVNDAGRQKIDTANQSIKVAAVSRAPEAPKTLDEAQIGKVWGEVIRTAPLKPKTFILNFRSGTDRLTEESLRQLPQIFAEIKAYPVAEVSITGHTDRVGSASTNAALAQKRAESTRDRLVEAGLVSDRLEVTSHGENNPIVPTADNVAEPRNRRVEVTIR